MKIVACYDNMGETVDRYTVYFDVIDNPQGYFMCLAMSDFPDHPQGYSQWSSGMIGKHNGKRINFLALPGNIKLHVWRRVTVPMFDTSPDELILEDGTTYAPSEADKKADGKHHADNAVFYIIGGI